MLEVIPLKNIRARLCLAMIVLVHVLILPLKILYVIAISLGLLIIGVPDSKIILEQLKKGNFVVV